MSPAKVANLGLRFALELCTLAALGYWGFRTGSGPLMKLVLGLGAPVVAATVWGFFIAPKARVPVPLAAWLILQALVFGAAAAGLAATGHARLTFGFLVVVLVNGALMAVWREETSPSP